MSSQQDDHADKLIARYEAAVFAMKATDAWSELYGIGFEDEVLAELLEEPCEDDGDEPAH